MKSLRFWVMSVFAAVLMATSASSFAQGKPPAKLWTFAVSGDSRNCGDFVMPVIAARVKAEGDLFYWHLGDFRALYTQDQDMLAMLPAGGTLPMDKYVATAWGDFIQHQLKPFGTTPVFLGRGNHETYGNKTREDYIKTFADPYLSRKEIVAQDAKDGAAAAPKNSPWYHVVMKGVDFITMDNASPDEFSAAQMTWLRGVLDRDLAADSGVTTIVAGMHEALPHSTSPKHSMEQWDLGMSSGEQAYRWFAAAQTSGKHVYLLASHSHFYSPNAYNSPTWQKAGIVVPGVIIGSAGAERYTLPLTADPTSITHIYGYLQAVVASDGTIDFVLKQVSEIEMIASKWPNAPLGAVYNCYTDNSQ